MAQVRKFYDGGTLTVNGKEYTAEQVNEYLSSGLFDPQEREALAGVVSAIQNGSDRYLDANSNSLSGDGNVNEDFAAYFGSLERADAGHSGWSTRKQNRHARRNTDFAVRDRALAKLGNIGEFEAEKTEREVAVTTRELGKGSGWFYKDGKYVEGPQNITNEKHIRDVFEYLASDDTGKRSWKLTGWGSSMDALKNWYSGQNADELLHRIRTNQLTDVDKEVLEYMGYSPSESDVQLTAYNAEKERFAQAGYDYDIWKNIIEINEDGEAVLLKGEDGKTAFSSFGGNGNYFFNDGFFSSGENNHLSFLKDHFVINGKVYKASDAKNEGSALYNILRSPGGFYDKNKSGDWEGADSIIKYLWNDETNYAKGDSVTDTYIEFLHNNPDIRWRAITGAYDASLQPGEQLIEYYNLNDPINEFGYSSPKWAVLDNNGAFLRNITSRGNLTGNAATPVSGRRIARTQGGSSIYDGLVIYDLSDDTGNVVATLYKNPVTGDMIYEGRIDAASGVDDQNYKIPADISDILNKYGFAFWQKLMSDRGLQERFAHTLGNTVNSGFRDHLVGDDGDILSVSDWQRLGLSEADAKMIYDKFNWFANNDNAGDRSRRRADRLVGRPVLINKNGGMIGKLQPGGAIGTNEAVGHTQYNLGITHDNPEDAAKIGKDEFTDADWADLTALVANATGIGLGISGAPIASGVAGIVGSGATLYADIARDGSDWGDWKDFGVNIALDAVSLLPFAGSASQAGKVVKTIKKMAPLVLKVLGWAGVGQGVKTAYDRIVNGDDWTVRDVSTVLNAVAGGITMAKSGVRGSKRPVTTSNEVEVKVKGKSKKVTLTDTEIKKVSEASDKSKALTDIVAKKYRAKIDDVDVSESFKTGKWYNPKSWFTKGDLKTTEVEIPSSWKGSIKTDGNAFTRWWSGRGYNQAQYNEFLRSGRWKEIKHSNTPEFSKGDVKPEGWKDVKEVRANKKAADGSVTSELIGYRGRAPKEVDATSVLREGFARSWNPFKMTPRQRQILRRAAIFTPNYVSRDSATYETPVHYVPIPIPVVQSDLGSRPRFKKGGIIKAHGGISLDNVTTLLRQGHKDLIPEALLEEWKVGKEQAEQAARAAGQTTYEYYGETYTVIPDSETHQIPASIDVPATELTNADIERMAQDWTWLNDPPASVDKYTNDYVNDYTVWENGSPSIVPEASLADDIAAAGYDAETTKALLTQQGYWSRKARRDALRQTAGNTPGGNGRRASYNISDAFRASKLGLGFAADAKQRDLSKKVLVNTLASSPSNESEYYNRFQDYGVGQQYTQAANEYRKPLGDPNADAMLLDASQRARNDQAIKLDLEGKMKVSQLFSDFNESDLTAKRAYAAKRTALENTARTNTAAAYNAYLTNEGKSVAQRQNLLDNYLTEQLSLYNADREMNFKMANQNEQLRYNSEIANLRAKYQKLLDADIASGVSTVGTTLEDWFTSNPKQYQEYLNRMTQLGTESTRRSMENYWQYNRQSMYSGSPTIAKKGGKVGSKKRSASDQIWIDNQKIHADAMKQLSKQAFEFLKMALS